MISGISNRRRFADLTEQEVLALAISSEEDAARISRTFAQGLRAEYPASAAVFDEMAAEEDTHRQMLIDLHVARFGGGIPLIRRENVGLERIREEARAMEHGAAEFYSRAAARTTDAATRKLLGDLAAAEVGHERHAEGLEAKHLDGDARAGEDKEEPRRFILTWVQPGLAGLMDGSVSTLAPIFATAFATQDT